MNTRFTQKTAAYCLAVWLACTAGLAAAQLSSPLSPPRVTPSATPAGKAPAASANKPATKPSAATQPVAVGVSKPAAAVSNGAAGVAAVAGVTAGTGAGVHSPNSPIAPLPDRKDVVPWSVLTALKTTTEKNKIIPVFNATQMALNQKIQKIQGFMMPLEPGEKQRHFLLTSVPLSCSFCLSGGPESMVEVRTKTPVKYALEPVVVEGKFVVLTDDPYGLYYRITEAQAVN